jgi:hypothetical protein
MQELATCDLPARIDTRPLRVHRRGFQGTGAGTTTGEANAARERRSEDLTGNPETEAILS